MLSRLAQLRKARRDPEFQPEMPDVAAEYMLAYLFEVGPVMFSGTGEAPLTHEEIAAWQANRGVELNSWEAQTLHRLSRDYLAQLQAARDPACPSPWVPEAQAAVRQAAVGALRAHVASLVRM